MDVFELIKEHGTIFKKKFIEKVKQEEFQQKSSKKKRKTPKKTKTKN